MAFQFLCPQGHLLQADASQMGRTINCPTCGMLFVVPTVTAPGAAQPVVPVPPPAPPEPPAAAPPVAEPPAAEPESDEIFDLKLGRRRRRHLAELDAPIERPVDESDGLPDLTAAQSSEFDPIESVPRMVHVICPRGHELITPRSSMGDEVLCPHCGEQFELQFEKTREYKQQQRRKVEVEQEKLGNNWLMWSIFVGVVVLAMLVAMIFFGSRS